MQTEALLIKNPAAVMSGLSGERTRLGKVDHGFALADRSDRGKPRTVRG